MASKIILKEQHTNKMVECLNEAFPVKTEMPVPLIELITALEIADTIKINRK